ncbi:hypothetical protein OPQ81_007179 [Rhizoctonia solani]|nr:hypothetical protein OPQ81_007179 [Rhizoctonia solani]
MPKPIPQSKLNDILCALDNQKSVSYIVSKHKVARRTVTNIRARYRPDLEVATAGRPCKLDATAIRHAVHLVTHGSSITTTEAMKTLSTIIGVALSTQTFCRALKSVGLRPVKKVKKPKLNTQLRKLRIEFARAHEHWTAEDWKWVLWSDEVKINRISSDGIVWGWIWGGMELYEQLIIGTQNFGGGSLMYWGCMGYDGTGFGCRLDGNMNQELYLAILEEEMQWSLEHLGLDAGEVIYQHDNASAHKAKACVNWLNNHGIKVMDWPPYSPDLNPIENLWAEIKRRLGTYEFPPQSIHELWERVQAEWDGIKPKYCRKLVESMPRRMKQVLDRKGGPTDY